MLEKFGDWFLTLSIDDRSIVAILLIMLLIWLVLTGVIYWVTILFLGYLKKGWELLRAQLK